MSCERGATRPTGRVGMAVGADSRKLARQAAAGLCAAFATLQAVDAMQTMQIISPWQTEQTDADSEPFRKFDGGEGNPLLRWWMDPEGMEPFVLGPYDELDVGAAAWDSEQADRTWQVRSQRIASFKVTHTLAICGAARFLGSVFSPSWEVTMLGAATAISLANVGRNFWCGLPVSGPSSHAIWAAQQHSVD